MFDAHPVLLAADDDPDILTLVECFARDQGFEVVGRRDGRPVLIELPTMNADLALLDVRMPQVGGFEVLRAIHDANSKLPVILMTAYPTVESAVEAVKLGALDYLSKPLDFDRLGGLLATLRLRTERQHVRLSDDSELPSRVEFCGMIGSSPVMQELFDTIGRLAPHARTALITGETGTGKELVARALHKLGPRRDRRFIPFNCSAVVETLFESELFGHTRGAFTGAVEAKAGFFERADGGTLLLDEVGELPPPVQAKLLRVLEDGEVQRVGATESRHVDVCAIAATNRPLVDEVAAGRFRNDLYYRLNVVEIALPPLRERRNDIPYLTTAFIKEFSKRFSKPLIGVSAGAERLLYRAPWPGNIRELRNVLEFACVLSDGRTLSEREMLVALGHGRCTASSEAASVASEPYTSSEPLPEIDRQRIEQVLQQVGGNRSAAARVLGISRRALYRRLSAFGLR
jgi:two-component system response regulator HydG